MIGGNGYREGAPSRELYIRWLQVNVFMPAMQTTDKPTFHALKMLLEAFGFRDFYAGCGREKQLRKLRPGMCAWRAQIVVHRHTLIGLLRSQRGLMSDVLATA